MLSLCFAACFVMLADSRLDLSADLCEPFTHILQWCFTGFWAITWMPQFSGVTLNYIMWLLMASQIIGISIVCSTIEHTSKETSKLCITGPLWWESSSGLRSQFISGFPSQRASNMEYMTSPWYSPWFIRQLSRFSACKIFRTTTSDRKLEIGHIAPVHSTTCFRYVDRLLAQNTIYLVDKSLLNIKLHLPTWQQLTVRLA